MPCNVAVMYLAFAADAESNALRIQISVQTVSTTNHNCNLPNFRPGAHLLQFYVDCVGAEELPSSARCRNSRRLSGSIDALC